MVVVLLWDGLATANDQKKDCLLLLKTRRKQKHYPFAQSQNRWTANACNIYP
jgi:hypothetical protein